MDRLGQHATGKPLNIQVFYSYQAESVNNSTAQFMLKVGPLISYPGIGPLQENYSLPPSVTPLIGTASNATLRQSQLSLCVTVKARVCDIGSIRKDGEAGESDVYTNCFSRGRKRRNRALNAKTDEPLSGLSF